MDINTIIAEAEETAIEQPASKEADTEIPEQVTQETEADISKKPDEALTPEQLAKREKNRESHLNSKLAEMRRANRDLQAQLAQRTPKPQTTEGRDTSTKPNPNDPFYKDKTWEQYNEDLTDWKLEQKLAENTKKTQETQNVQELSKWAEERGSVVDNRIVELEAAIPDFARTLEEVEDILPPLTPEQARIALEADDINLAVYALQKEGKLMDMLQLPPSRLAAEIAKAEIRGQQYLKQEKPVTNAPKPMASAKGVGVGSKGDADIVDEILAYVRK